MSKRKSPTSYITPGVRATLALGLSLVLCLSFFNLGAWAAPQEEQDAPGTYGPKYPLEVVQDGHGYIVSQVNGEAVCRAATPEELKSMNRRDPNMRLRPINHPELFRNRKQPVNGAIPEETIDSDIQSDNQNADAQDGGVETTTATGTSEALEPSAGLVVIVRASARLEANPAAKAAVIKAANHWEALIQNKITVIIDVDYGPDRFGDTAHPYGSSTLASTNGGSLLVPSYAAFRSRLSGLQSNAAEQSLYAQLPSGASGVPTDLPTPNVKNILLDSAVARALKFVGADAQQDPTTGADAVTQPSIGFNSNFTFDLDPSDGVTTGQTDFDSVATHEIGHALGFSSEEGAGQRTLSTGQAYLMTPWDIFRFKPATAPSLSNFATAQRVMTVGASATDLQLAFYGPSVTQPGLSTGGPDPGPTGPGDKQQSSHWRADETGGTYFGIMDPTIARGQRYSITDNDKRALDFMGYQVVGISTTLPPPANDNLASAQTITGCSGTVTGTNAGATKEDGEPLHDPAIGTQGGTSVWYQWTAPSNGSVTITTQGSNFDTLLGIYTGTTVGSLSTIIKNDDVPDVQGQPHQTYSSVTFTAIANTTYKIAVDGYDGETGNITLNWNESNCGVTPTPTPAPTPVPTPAPQPTTPFIQFDAPKISVTENDPNGYATIRLSRNITTAPATVEYFTSDNAGMTPCQTNTSGAASERCDYATQVGTLHFAAGEVYKMITIPIINDSYFEPLEVFSISLRNPQGATIWGPTSINIEILNDDGTGGTLPNPIDDQAFFIKEQYIDFLGRVAEPAGFQFWMDRMSNCPAGQVCDRIDTSKRFFESDEFDQRGFFVYRLYDVGLGRFPLYAEFVPDVARLNGFQTVEEQRASKDAYLSDFLKKTEFANLYGQYVSANNTLVAGQAANFVNALCLKAGITPASKQTLINNLANGTRTPAQTLEDFILTPEISNPGTKFYDRARIVMQYFGYLRRDPEAGGFDFWWDQLTNPARGHLQDYRFMVGGFIGSDEYKFRFAQK